MALTVAGREVRPLTAEEVLRMVEHGILEQDERIELLDGVLTRVSPEGEDHAEVKRRLTRWLYRQPVADALEIRTESPLLVPQPTYLPEPDFAVLELRSGRHDHPASALLVIEIAVRSRKADLERKPPLYAAAGVVEYWVVDPPARRLERFLDPVAGGYASNDVLLAPASVTPLAFPATPLGLEPLFADL